MVLFTEVLEPLETFVRNEEAFIAEMGQIASDTGEESRILAHQQWLAVFSRYHQPQPNVWHFTPESTERIFQILCETFSVSAVQCIPPAKDPAVAGAASSWVAAAKVASALPTTTAGEKQMDDDYTPPFNPSTVPWIFTDIDPECCRHLPDPPVGQVVIWYMCQGPKLICRFRPMGKITDCFEET